MRSTYLSVFSLSFNFFSVVCRGSKIYNSASCIFFVVVVDDYYKIWSSGRDYMIRLYHKLLLVSLRFILQERFWVVHIPFVYMVKFKFLAHFPVDPLSHPVLSSLTLLLLSFGSFSHQCYLMVFHWCPSDSKSPQVSRALLSILANLNDAEVWIVLTRPLISTSSSFITNLLAAIPSTPITIGINVTFMFHSLFFQYSNKV